MGLIPAWRPLLNDIAKPITESSEQFKNRLKELDLENESSGILPIAYGLDDYEPEQREYFEEHYAFIDSKIFQDILSITRDKRLTDEDLNNIAFILKWGYNHKILAELNGEFYNTKSDFNEQFFKLCEKISHNKQYLRLRLNSENTDDTIDIDNKNLINLLLVCFKERVLKTSETAFLLVEIENSKESAIDYTKIELDRTTFDLLEYLTLYTELPFKGDIEEVRNGTFTNELLEFVFELLCIAKLIDDKAVGSLPKDYLRTRINRHLKRNPGLLSRFDPEKEGDYSSYYFDDDDSEIIDRVNYYRKKINSD